VVFGVKLVKVDEKEPVPVPSDVLVDRAMVGLVLVDQTTPLAVMEAPPSAVILPPAVAEVVVIVVMELVVNDGMETMDNVSLRQRTEAPNDLMLKFLFTKPW
jgi:hypothetical protein